MTRPTPTFWIQILQHRSDQHDAGVCHTARLSLIILLPLELIILHLDCHTWSPIVDCCAVCSPSLLNHVVLAVGPASVCACVTPPLHAAWAWSFCCRLSLIMRAHDCHTWSPIVDCCALALALILAVVALCSHLCCVVAACPAACSFTCCQTCARTLPMHVRHEPSQWLRAKSVHGWLPDWSSSAWLGWFECLLPSLCVDVGLAWCDVLLDQTMPLMLSDAWVHCPRSVDCVQSCCFCWSPVCLSGSILTVLCMFIVLAFGCFLCALFFWRIEFSAYKINSEK